MSEPTIPNKLFVYGSLKPGGRAHYMLAGYITKDEPVAAYVNGYLYDVNGRFPALELAEDTKCRVYGLVYRIQFDKFDMLLKNLDRYEGYPMLYDRKNIRVRLHDVGIDGPVWAMVYYGVDPELFKGEVIESGVWETST